MPDNDGGTTTIGCVSAAEAPLAVMLLVVFAATGVVAMLNGAELEPAGIVTVAGGLAALETELESETLNAVGATVPSVTLLFEAVLPPTAEGWTVSHEMSTGFSVNVAYAVEPA